MRYEYFICQIALQMCIYYTKSACLSHFTKFQIISHKNKTNLFFFFSAHVSYLELWLWPEAKRFCI